MNLAQFVQFQVVMTPLSLHTYGLDTAGRLWEKIDTFKEETSNLDWRLVPMPQTEKPRNAYEKLQDLQDKIRDELGELDGLDES
jgi:hypothetical protein